MSALQKNYTRQYFIWLCSGSLIAVFFSIIAACQSPISGLNLSWSTDHAIAKALPLKTQIAAINSIDGWISLQASDFAPYPNREFKSYHSYWQFLHRQQQLYRALRAQHVQFTTVDGDTIAISSERSRNVGNLPLHFWQGILIAIAAWYLGVLVFLLDPRSARNRYFFLASGALFTATLTSSIYSSRELAMSAPLLVILCDVKFLADLLLSTSLICLLLHFPKRIGHYSIDIALFCLMIAWFLSAEAGLLNTPKNRQFPIPCALIIVAALALRQFQLSVKDPLNNAALFCFSAFFCSSLLFILHELSGIPRNLGNLLSTDYTTALLWVLLGLAVGIGRYKLNNLTRHRYLLFFMASTASFSVIVIGHYIKLGEWPEYTPAILLILIGGLSLAIFHAGKAFAAPPFTDTELLMFTAINYQASEKNIDYAWQTFLKQLLQPQAIHVDDASYPRATISLSGKFLHIPKLKGPGSLCCEYAQYGKRLFNSSDAQKINTLIFTAQGLIANSQQHYCQQQAINKLFAGDLQRSIGEALVPALRYNECGPIKEIIRDVLTETHTISSGLYGRRIALHELIADLQPELEQRLERQGLTLNWTANLPKNSLSLEYPIYKAVSSGLRELAKLSGQTPDISNICFDIKYDAGRLFINFGAHNKGAYRSLKHITENEILRRTIAPLQGEVALIENKKYQFNFQLPPQLSPPSSAL